MGSARVLGDTGAKGCGKCGGCERVGFSPGKLDRSAKRIGIG